MAERRLGTGGVAITLLMTARNDDISFARLQTTAVAGKLGFDYDAIEDVRIAVSELCGTVIACAAADAELRIEIRGDAEVLTVAGSAPLADGAVLEPDELSGQVLDVVTDAYDYAVADGVVSFHMTRAAKPAAA